MKRRQPSQNTETTTKKKIAAFNVTLDWKDYLKGLFYTDNANTFCLLSSLPTSKTCCRKKLSIVFQGLLLHPRNRFTACVILFSIPPFLLLPCVMFVQLQTCVPGSCSLSGLVLFSASSSTGGDARQPLTVFTQTCQESVTGGVFSENAKRRSLVHVMSGLLCST